MTDNRSAATRQADIHEIEMALADIDLGEIAATVTTPLLMRAPGIGRVEFIGRDGLVISSSTSDAGVPAVGMGRVLLDLAKAVAGDADSQYIEAARVVDDGTEDATLRIVVTLTPVTVTLPGIEGGLFGIERLQTFAMAHENADVEALPTEQGEALARVREMLA